MKIKIKKRYIPFIILLMGLTLTSCDSGYNSDEDARAHIRELDKGMQENKQKIDESKKEMKRREKEIEFQEKFKNNLGLNNKHLEEDIKKMNRRFRPY